MKPIQTLSIGLLILSSFNVYSQTFSGFTAQKCASENGTCSAPTYPATIAYGGNSKYTAPRTITKATLCSNSVFGDPSYGAAKSCYLLTPNTTQTSQLWSSPSTWGGKLPVANSNIVVPKGKSITLDTDITVGDLDIEGTLLFANKDIKLSAASIQVSGSLLVGTIDKPYSNQAVITLTGQPVAVNDGTSRGLTVIGGTLAVYGTPPTPVWTKINALAAAGTTTLTLKDSTNWKAGDTIVVGSTDFYNINPTEKIVLSKASGTSLSLLTPLQKYRWGTLQYVTSKGMSLSQDTSYTPPVTPSPVILDERAAVGNLSRNIVIQGLDDSAWQTKGFGAHLMVMDLKSKVNIDGVEFRRVGQAGVTGRYPIHFHMLSYDGDTGALLGDASTIIVKRSTVSESSNRCLVIHSTNGITVDSNICYNIKGHAFFLENAVERRNTLKNNLALHVRDPDKDVLLQVHEGGNGGSSGFWITNPDNILTGNLAADNEGSGFWQGFPTRPLGLSKKVDLHPNSMMHALFDNNTANSNRIAGMLTELDPVDDAGNTGLDFYIPTTNNGAVSGTEFRTKFELKHVTSFKNSAAYRNRVIGGLYTEWMVADNPGAQLAGSGGGTIQRGLFIGNSFNNATAAPTFNNEPSSAFTTYNQGFNMVGNTIVNMPFVEGKPSGMFDMSDFYLSPVNKFPINNMNNRLINSSPGFRVPPPNLWKPELIGNNNYTLSGAIWDPYGEVGPKENFWVYDVPFLTTGATCQPVLPAGKNGASCNGQYYGMDSFVTDFSTNPFMPLMPIDITRVDDKGQAIGRWFVGDGKVSTKLPNMRHFAAHKGGNYILRFPNSPLPTSFSAVVRNAFRADDSFIFAVSFDGTKEVTGYVVGGWQYNRNDPKGWGSLPQLAKYVRWFKPASSLAEVKASVGDKLWQDKANNLVWIKYSGNLPYQNGIPVKNTADDLYRPFSLVLDGK